MKETDSLQEIVNYMEGIESDAKKIQESISQSKGKGNVSLNAIILVIGCIALSNLYFASDLVQELDVIMRTMTKMYGQFGEMSQRMHGMRLHVDNMSKNITLMPVMVEQMGHMSSNMGIIKDNVTNISSNMSEMRGRVDSLNQDVTVMSQLFHSTNNKIVQIRHNVNNMSRVMP